MNSIEKYAVATRALLSVFLSCLAVVLVWLGLSLFTVFRSHDEEAVLAQHVDLNSEWQTFESSRVMRTAKPMNVIMIETNSLNIEQPSEKLFLLDRSMLKMEGYVTLDTGRVIDLDHVGFVAHGSKKCVEMSAAPLETSADVYRVRSVSLRSNFPSRAGQVIWFSYDPSKTKSGIEWPPSIK